MKRLKRKNIVIWKHVLGGFGLFERTENCRKKVELVGSENRWCGCGEHSRQKEGRLLWKVSWILSSSLSPVQSCLVFVSQLTSETFAVEAGPWNDSCSFLLSEWTSYAFWESKPFNSCGLVDKNQFSMLNRQNLSKLRQCLQIIFNHISYCIKSYILFLKRRPSKLSKLANVRM